MATVAEIINAAAARQEAPTKGLLRGLAARRENQALAAEVQSRRGEIELKREQMEQEQAEEDKLREMRREAGVMVAADTPDKWQRAQSAGLIDADVPFEMRDMSVAVAAAYEKGSPAQRALMEQQAEQRAQAWREKQLSITEAGKRERAQMGGMTIETTPEGGFRYSTGAQMAQPLGKEQRKKVEQKVFDATEQMARYRGIRDAFRPELLKLPAKIKGKWASMKSFVGQDLTPEEKDLLVDQSRLYARTANNLALFIKDISGAAVSEQEAQRLSKTMPTTDDDPVTFETKLGDNMDAVQAALWRYNYAQRKGLNPLATGIELGEIPEIIDQEGQRLELETRRANPQLSDEEVDAEVARRLRSIFGEMQ